MTFIVVMALTAVSVMSARSNAIGGNFSLNGAGLVYRHDIRNNVFYEIGLSIDYSHSVFASKVSPGVRARYGHNIVFAEKRGQDGVLRCYGGAGAVIGYLTDAFNSKRGFAGGLTGTIGVEYVFKVPVILSLSITPCLGLQLCSNDDSHQLDLYYSGITYDFLPCIGIKYSF